MLQSDEVSIAQNISAVKRYCVHCPFLSTICLGERLADDYGTWIRRAYREWHDAHDPERMPWAEVQRQCAEILRVPETSVAVLKWKDGQQEPTLAEFAALEAVLESPRAYLAFGQLPMRMASAQPPVTESYGERVPDSGRKRRAK
jgi:hypothetical protein